jgi:hypothetical protein
VEIQPSADTLLPPGLDSSAVAPLPPPSAKPASSIVQRSAQPLPSAKKP